MAGHRSAWGGCHRHASRLWEVGRESSRLEPHVVCGVGDPHCPWRGRASLTCRGRSSLSAAWESLADRGVGEPRMSSSLLGVAVPVTSMPHVGTDGSFSCRVALTSQVPVGTGCLLLVENVGQLSTFLAEGHPVPGGQIHYKTDPLSEQHSGVTSIK